jgi:hypothetical protein
MPGYLLPTDAWLVAPAASKHAGGVMSLHHNHSRRHNPGRHQSEVARHNTCSSTQAFFLLRYGGRQGERAHDNGISARAVPSSSSFPSWLKHSVLNVMRWPETPWTVTRACSCSATLYPCSKQSAGPYHMSCMHHLPCMAHHGRLPELEGLGQVEGPREGGANDGREQRGA